MSGKINKNAIKKVVGRLKAGIPSDLHEAFALQFVHPVGGAVEPLPLRVQHRVGDLPPRLAVEQQGEADHAADGDQHGVHCLVLAVHLKDGQQRHAGDQAGQDEDKEDEGRHAARLLPLLFTCRRAERKSSTVKNIHMM